MLGDGWEGVGALVGTSSVVMDQTLKCIQFQLWRGLHVGTSRHCMPRHCISAVLSVYLSMNAHSRTDTHTHTHTHTHT